MLIGQVRDGFPRLTLLVRGASGQDEIEFVVDTGFDGRLTLSSRWITMLGAMYIGERPHSLADGSVTTYPIFRVVVGWEEEDRSVIAVGMGDVPLMGVRMLDGCSLTIDMTEGGEVVIEEA